MNSILSDFPNTVRINELISYFCSSSKISINTSFILKAEFTEIIISLIGIPASINAREIALKAQLL